jgi:hypothetical protein
MRSTAPFTVPPSVYRLMDPRRSRRGLTRLRGHVTDREGQTLGDCLVSNISAFGVCMRVSRPLPVACEDLRLTMDGDPQLYVAKVMWRDGVRVGVQLIDPV